MPQLDTVTFLSQLFWLVIIFGAFYLTVLTDILPSFSRVLKSRLKKLKSNKDAMYSLGDEKGETSSLYDSSLSTGLDGSRYKPTRRFRLRFNFNEKQRKLNSKNIHGFCFKRLRFNSREDARTTQSNQQAL